MGDDDQRGDTRGRRVIFFDLDGCLVDSTEPILQCLNAALVEFDLGPIPRYDLARHIGPPLQVTITGLLEEQGANPALMQPLVDAYRSRYQSASIELAVAYPGIPELVASVAEVERVAVCTSKPTRWAVPILEHLRLASYFEVIVGPELTEAEPKIETLGRALGELEPVDRSASVMIGDRYHDIDAARHHGLSALGVGWGFGSEDELVEAGAVAVAHSVVELQNRLRSLLVR